MARDDLFQTPAETRPETASADAALQRDKPAAENFSRNQPLAARMRPRNLDEFAGQTHILAPGQLLRRAIEADRIQSLIFYGPPGTGKTSLAQIIARQTRSKFERLSGVGIQCGRHAPRAGRRGQPPGKHRPVRPSCSLMKFTASTRRSRMCCCRTWKAAWCGLIGATTHNPFFFVNSPLVSRSQIFELQPLDEDELFALLRRALADAERGLGHLKIRADEEALRHLAKIADGDARKALNSLEIAALTTAPDARRSRPHRSGGRRASIQKKAVVYDGDEDAHYDTISAFIKSMRGSDPDATLYWLAKMIHAGEDPRFIARRILICAAEDVGLADPMALVLANAAFQAAEFVGWPEARIPAGRGGDLHRHGNKSNSAVLAIDAALEDVESGRTLAVPEHLRDAHYAGAERLGHGKGYQYAHDHPGHFVAQDYLGADKITTSRPSRAWKRKSRSAWKNGARRCPRRGRIIKNDLERPKSRVAKRNPSRAAKNLPGGARCRVRATLRPAEGAILLEKRGHYFVFRAVAG